MEVGLLIIGNIAKSMDKTVQERGLGRVRKKARKQDALTDQSRNGGFPQRDARQWKHTAMPSCAAAGTGFKNTASGRRLVEYLHRRVHGEGRRKIILRVLQRMLDNC